MPARPRCFHRYLVELTLIGIWVALLTLPVAAQSTLTPEPTLTPTPIPEPNLLLIAQPEALTLAVTAEMVNLTGFSFGVLISGELVVIELAERVDALVLLRNTAPAGACFQFVLSGESPVLPSACSNTGYLYRVQVAPSDQFWYDRLTNRSRDVGIISSGELTGTLCSGAFLEVGCEIMWDEATIPTPTPTATVDVQATNRVAQATPLPTLTPMPVVQPTQVVTQTYPCEATVWAPNVTSVRQLRVQSVNDLNRQEIAVGQTIVLLSPPTGRSNDLVYQISFASSPNNPIGWISKQYIRPGANCPP
ncbi:MAG: hypothetical protein J0M33_20270 [Anaerolineae bacterium]|nr:hypothetical protein [Anaerolineae bacterium]